MRKVKYPNLVAEMAKSGEKQLELANLLNTTRASISRKLAGLTDWSFKDVLKICEHYDKDFRYLFK